MSLKLLLNQYVRCAIKQALLVSLLMFGAAVCSKAQSQKPNLPDPVKFINKLDIVANAAREALENMGLRIDFEDRKGGKITTKPYEFITGSLTAGEVEKVAVKTAEITRSLIKAQYSVEVILEIVSPTETMVSVHTKMEALNKDVDGTEKWIPLTSLGTYERRVLGRINGILQTNKRSSEDERKGFWGKKPQPVDPRQPRFPTGPSR
jgi:hypothetical protein